MSACTRCGTPIVPGATFCNSCGLQFPPAPPAAIFTAPAGTQKALIGPTPLWQAVSGLFFIIIGVVMASVNSFFAPVAFITILIGIILLVLGLIGKPIFSQQVVYQGSQPSAYQTRSLKQCPRCGSMIPAYALMCERCGASQ